MARSVVLVSMLASAITLSGATFPVRARIVSGSPPRVELTNTGAQSITAWSFAVTSPNAQGGVHREVHSADVYLGEVTRGLPRSEEHLDWLRPGQSRALPIDVVPPGAAVELIAVVLADGTAVGDPQTITSWFDHRQRERDELHRVVDAFNTVLESQRGVAALEALKRRLAVSGDGQESVPHRAAREAVDAYLSQATPGNDDATDRAARTYAALVARQYALAVKHAQRKQPL